MGRMKRGRRRCGRRRRGKRRGDGKNEKGKKKEGREVGITKSIVLDFIKDLKLFKCNYFNVVVCLIFSLYIEFFKILKKKVYSCIGDMNVINKLLTVFLGVLFFVGNPVYLIGILFLSSNELYIFNYSYISDLS